MEYVNLNEKLNKFACIYLIKNTINDKIYIGQAKDFKSRYRDHKKFKHGPKLKHAILKYGWASFEFYILERVTDLNLLNQREQYYLDFYLPFGKRGYNICRIAGTSAGYKHTNESRAKIRKWRAQTDYTGKNNPNYGNKWTKEQKDFISKLNKGRWLGKKHTEAAKEKTRIAKLGPKNPNSTEWHIQCIETNNIVKLLGGIKRFLSKFAGSSYFKLLRGTDPNWRLVGRQSLSRITSTK